MAKQRAKLKKWQIALLIVLGVLLALLLGAFAVMKIYLGQMGRVGKDEVEIIAPEDEFFDEDVAEETPSPSTPAEPPEESATEPEEAVGAGTEPAGDASSAAGTETDSSAEVLNIDPADVEWSFIERIEDDHLINILLVGQDKYPGTQSNKRQRSDSMILCSINPKTGKVSMISFLRDMYVEIPGGYSDNRLNVPFVLGGFPLLNQTLTTNFGVSIDANFSVDMTGFTAILEMLGGVDVELTAEEAEYMRTTWHQDTHEGVNHLDAQYALFYSQLRKVGNDFTRTGRQRKVLMSVFQQVKGLPASELLTLMYDMLPYMTTDLTDTEILALAYRLLPMLSSVSVETHSVPSSGSYRYATIRKMSVILPDREKIRQQLQDEYLPLN